MDNSKLKVRFDALVPHLDERMRRMVAASETLSEGYGAISEVSRTIGVSRRAISQGLKELKEHVPGPRMSIMDTKPFMQPAVLHSIFVHSSPVTGNQVLPVGAAGYRRSQYTW